MTVRLRSFDDLAPMPRVVTIGTFDGVHLGHRFLLDQTVARARELGVAALAVTFEPIPAQILRPDKFPGRICSAEEKLARLAAAGLDEILTLEFSRDFSQQTPEEFMARLTAAATPRELWVGEAFALGKNRAGDVTRLTAIGRELGYAVHAVRRRTDGEEIISSSAIRRAIQAGDVARAARYLRRPFRVGGPVIHGAHLGRTIGYPTANMELPSDLVPPADGIYVSQATLPGERAPRPAMTYVGTRPTVNGGPRQIETHLFDFDGDLYGQILAVDFLDYLRPDATFAGLDALVAQLRADEAAARAWFARRPAGEPAAAPAGPIPTA